MRNKPEDILWSLEMIKRSANKPDGCTIKHTGGFIKDGQIDDLIELINDCINIKEKYKSQKDEAKLTEKEKKMLKAFNDYWSGKSLKKNE